MVCKKQDGLEAELAIAEIEEVFQGGTEEVDDHGIVVALRSEPANEGNAYTACESLVDL